MHATAGHLVHLLSAAGYNCDFDKYLTLQLPMLPQPAPLPQAPQPAVHAPAPAPGVASLTSR